MNGDSTLIDRTILNDYRHDAMVDKSPPRRSDSAVIQRLQCNNRNDGTIHNIWQITASVTFRIGSVNLAAECCYRSRQTPHKATACYPHRCHNCAACVRHLSVKRVGCSAAPKHSSTITIYQNRIQGFAVGLPILFPGYKARKRNVRVGYRISGERHQCWHTPSSNLPQGGPPK